MFGDSVLFIPDHLHFFVNKDHPVPFVCKMPNKREHLMCGEDDFRMIGRASAIIRDGLATLPPPTVPR